MTGTHEIPNAGYSLEKIYFPKQSHRLVERAESLPDEAALEFGWNWKFLETKGRFEVLIHIALGPSKPRPEEVKVIVCAVFSIVGEPSVALSDFARLQGPAILVPYAREAIGSMTGRSFFGPLYLPPLNILKLIAGLDTNATTAARQLKETGQSSKPTEALP